MPIKFFIDKQTSINPLSGSDSFIHPNSGMAVGRDLNLIENYLLFCGWSGMAADFSKISSIR
jgi:hypothetical protein